MAKSYKRSPILDVHVSEHHIQTAIQRNSRYCMIAEAIKDGFPQFNHVAVDVQSIRLTDAKRNLRHIYLTPRIVQKVLIMFDQGKLMSPFDFRLKAAHTVGASVRQLGKVKRVKLGKRRIITSSNRRDHPDIVGGRAPPRLPGASKHPAARGGMHPNARALRHPSANNIREFGMRLFTEEDPTKSTWPPKGLGLTHDG